MSASRHSDRDRRLSTAGSRLRPNLGRLEQGALALAALGALYAIWLGVGLPAIPIGPGGSRSDTGTPFVAYVNTAAPSHAIAGTAIPALERPNRRQSRPVTTSTDTVSPPLTSSAPGPVETTRQSPRTPAATAAPTGQGSSSPSTTPPSTTPSTPTPPSLPDVPSVPVPQLPSVPGQALPQTPSLPQAPGLPAPLPLPPTPPLPTPPLPTLP
jgi:hypothetical protein